MLNFIWAGMIIIGFVFAIFTGNINNTVNAFISSASEGINLVISMAGIMCFWCGLMEIANSIGLIDKLTKVIKPLSRILFPKIKDDKVIGSIFMNISANFLGLGNAATPLGIKAMQEMQKLNYEKTVATNEMCMFVVLNTASIQLIPTSIIAIRAAAGAINPTDIIVQIWISSMSAAIIAVVLCRVMARK